MISEMHQDYAIAYKYYVIFLSVMRKTNLYFISFLIKNNNNMLQFTFRAIVENGLIKTEKSMLLQMCFVSENFGLEISTNTIILKDYTLKW